MGASYRSIYLCPMLSIDKHHLLNSRSMFTIRQTTDILFKSRAFESRVSIGPIELGKPIWVHLQTHCSRSSLQLSCSYLLSVVSKSLFQAFRKAVSLGRQWRVSTAIDGRVHTAWGLEQTRRLFWFQNISKSGRQKSLEAFQNFIERFWSKSIRFVPSQTLLSRVIWGQSTFR